MGQILPDKRVAVTGISLLSIIEDVFMASLKAMLLRRCLGVLLFWFEPRAATAAQGSPRTQRESAESSRVGSANFDLQGVLALQNYEYMRGTNTMIGSARELLAWLVSFITSSSSLFLF